MGAAIGRGMTLVMSIWDDHDANMLWLDSNYPLDKPASDPGIARGPCPTTSGVPKDVESNAPKSKIIWDKIKYGDINSTFTPTPGPGPTPSGDCTGKGDGYFCDPSDSTKYFQCPSDQSYSCMPPGTVCDQVSSAMIQCEQATDSCDGKDSGYYCSQTSTTKYYNCPSLTSYDCAPPGTHCEQSSASMIQCSASVFSQ